MINIKKLLTKILQWMNAPYIKSTWDGSSIPSENTGTVYYIRDTSDRWITRCACYVYSTASGSRDAGAVGGMISARHPTANVENNIIAYVNPDGTREYAVSDSAKFRNAIGIPYCITSEGSENGWAWRKFSDNTFEAWYSGTATTAITGAIGSLYQSGSSLTLTIPSGIGATSVLYGDVMMFSSSYGVWAYVLGMTSSTITYRGFSAVSRASASYTVKAYIRGAYS